MKNRRKKKYQIKSRINGELIGWENIELISDRPLETMVRRRSKSARRERERGRGGRERDRERERVEGCFLPRFLDLFPRLLQ